MGDQVWRECVATEAGEYHGLETDAETLAADFVNPKDLREGTTIVDKLVEMTDGGCDFTFDATGNVSPGMKAT